MKKQHKELVKARGIAGLNDRELVEILNAEDAVVAECIKEYTRRQARKDAPAKIGNAHDCYNALAGYLHDLDHEQFFCIFLTRANRIISIENISKGGMTGTVVDTRIVFRKALEAKACAIVLAHNHPSGNPQPSEADNSLTKRIVAAGKLIEISVLDHIIYTNNGFYSYANEGEI